MRNIYIFLRISPLYKTFIITHILQSAFLHTSLGSRDFAVFTPVNSICCFSYDMVFYFMDIMMSYMFYILLLLDTTVFPVFCLQVMLQSLYLYIFLVHIWENLFFNLWCRYIYSTSFNTHLKFSIYWQITFQNIQQLGVSG